jgi:hypothetical protein
MSSNSESASESEVFPHYKARTKEEIEKLERKQKRFEAKIRPVRKYLINRMLELAEKAEKKGKKGNHEPGALKFPYSNPEQELFLTIRSLQDLRMIY